MPTKNSHIMSPNIDTKTGNREPQQNYRIATVSNELLGLKHVLRRQPCPPVSELLQNIKLVVTNLSNSPMKHHGKLINHV